MAVGGWRSLGLFWLAALVIVGAGAGTLQSLGPPTLPAQHATAPVEHGPAVAPPVTHTASSEAPHASTRALGEAIPDPDPALLEPAPDLPNAKLPRIAEDGRTPMRTYAPAVDTADTRPKVALLVTGIGMSDAESRVAIDTLPAGVTLGVSPYTPEPGPLLASIRAHGHEFLVTLPMESQGYPLNGSGPHALLTGEDPAVNARNLQWVLSRIAGAAGVSGASDGLRGERFAGSPSLFGPVLRQLAERGLLYVDPRVNTPVSGPVIGVNLVVDDPPQRAGIDARLAELEERARDGKPAVGLVELPRPVTLDRLGSWVRGLEARGIALVPVTALLPKSATR